MRRLLTVIALLCLAPASSADVIAETLPDDPVRTPRGTDYNIIVVLQYPQPALFGPDALAIQRRRQDATYRDTWGHPSIWRYVGLTNVGAEAVVDESGALRFDELLTSFDFNDATASALYQLDRNANWSIRAINRANFFNLVTGKWEEYRTARNLFYSTGADGLLFVRFTYFVSRDLAHVRLVAELRLYDRHNRNSNLFYQAVKRRYEYLSPDHGGSRRPWRDNERAALESVIDKDYASRTAAYPHNEKAYRKEATRALKELRQSDLIPMPDSMLESWSRADLAVALDLATQSMATMLERDLADLPADELVEGEKLGVKALQPDGDRKRIKAREFFRDGANTVYQTGGGNLYSLPTER